MSTCCSASRPAKAQNVRLWVAGTVAFIAAWFVLYRYNKAAQRAIVMVLEAPMVHRAASASTGEPSLPTRSRFSSMIPPKVLTLLTIVVFGMGVVRSFFSPERTRAVLAGRHEGLGNVAAAVLGIVTRSARARRCPCLSASSALACRPAERRSSFLISAPMVNEVALGLLFGLLGWKVALAYLGFGLGIAVVAGWIISRLHLEGWLQDWVRN